MISSIKKSLIFLLFALASVRADSFLDSPEPFFVLVLIFFIGAFCVVCLKANGHACQGVQGDFRDVPYPNTQPMPDQQMASPTGYINSGYAPNSQVNQTRYTQSQFNQQPQFNQPQFNQQQFAPQPLWSPQPQFNPSQQFNQESPPKY